MVVEKLQGKVNSKPIYLSSCDSSVWIHLWKCAFYWIKKFWALVFVDSNSVSCSDIQLVSASWKTMNNNQYSLSSWPVPVNSNDVKH